MPGFIVLLMREIDCKTVQSFLANGMRGLAGVSGRRVLTEFEVHPIAETVSMWSNPVGVRIKPDGLRVTGEPFGVLPEK